MTYRLLASCYAHMGRLDDAREIVKRLCGITSVRCGGQLTQQRLQFLEIDRLPDERGSAKFEGSASALLVAVGGYHHDRQIGSTLFDFTEQLQPIHARHVGVRKDSNQRGAGSSRRDACATCRLPEGQAHTHDAASAIVAR